MKHTERWPCPYAYCYALPLVNADGSIRRHKFEGRDCPGGTFNIRKSAAHEREKMQERIDSMLR